MLETSKKEPQKILRLRYRCLKEYDLEGDRVDTDEFVYDSDVSVEDRVQVPRLGKTWPAVLKGSVKKKETPSMGRDESDGLDAAKAARSTAFQGRTTRHWCMHKLPVPHEASHSTTEKDIVPHPDMRILDPSVENRKIEEVEELPIFADGVSTAISRYEAVFEPVHRNLDHGI